MVTIHGRLQRTWRRVHAAHLRSTLLLTETTKGFGVSVNAVRDDIMGQVLDVELTKKKILQKPQKPLIDKLQSDFSETQTLVSVVQPPIVFSEHASYLTLDKMN